MPAEKTEGGEEKADGRRLIIGATANSIGKNWPVLLLPGSNEASVARMPTRLLPGLQDAIAGDDGFGEFSQQQQSLPWLIIWDEAILQVA